MHVDPERFGTLRRVCGLTQARCADLLKVSVRTVKNWEHGTCKIPWAAFKVLRLISRDDIEQPGWNGWYFRRGLLWSPDDRPFDPVKLYPLHWTFAEIRFLRATVEKLRSAAATHQRPARGKPELKLVSIETRPASTATPLSAGQVHDAL